MMNELLVPVLGALLSVIFIYILLKYDSVTTERIETIDGIISLAKNGRKLNQYQIYLIIECIDGMSNEETRLFTLEKLIEIKENNEKRYDSSR